MKNFFVFCGLFSIFCACSPAKIAEKKAKEAAQLQEYLTSVPDSVEVMPLFQGGGVDKFSNWVKSYVQYPQELIEDYINGYSSQLEDIVKIQFIVEPDGSIKQADILECHNNMMAKAVRRIILSSPKWKPGIQKGKAVRVRFVLPVWFKVSATDKAALDQLKREREQSQSRRF